MPGPTRRSATRDLESHSISRESGPIVRTSGPRFPAGLAFNLAALAIFQVLFVWNDFLIGFTLAQDNVPIAPALAGQLRQFSSNLDIIAPASFFSAVIPLTIFALFQRYFVQGLLAGSVK